MLIPHGLAGLGAEFLSFLNQIPQHLFEMTFRVGHDPEAVGPREAAYLMCFMPFQISAKVTKSLLSSAVWHLFFLCYILLLHTIRRRLCPKHIQDCASFICVSIACGCRGHFPRSLHFFAFCHHIVLLHAQACFSVV